MTLPTPNPKSKIKNPKSRLLLITQRALMRPTFEGALESALKGGARFIQLREKDLSAREMLALARAAQTLCEKYDAKLLINARADIAFLSGAAGVHLPENGLPSQLARASFPHQAVLCGVSAHSLEAARRAQNEGADYLVFGSVFLTASHPGEAAAGLEKLREICAQIDLPIFAVGGIEAENTRACRETGAFGVAAIRAVWKAENVEAATHNLLDALED